MAITNPLRKAMIVIAVSNYNGAYTNLPGTLTSAARIVNWARQPGPGRGYTVLEITDANRSAVTVDRLKNEITPFLQNNIIDRLVVYFAGHGLVRSTADQYWLLTDAVNDTREGVDMNAFKRGLARQGIGAHHPELRQGQLCFFVDACRSTSEYVLDFEGDPIITGGGATQKMQIDLFFATMLGQKAYQPKGAGGQPPYCLFSDTLTEALEGKVPQVIENLHHPFKPAIVNNLLADYLDVEVPIRAARLRENMEPDNNSLIRMAHNYYDLLTPSLNVTPPPPDGDPENQITPTHDASELKDALETAEMGEAGGITDLSTRTQEFEMLLAEAEDILNIATVEAAYPLNIVIEGSHAIAVPHGATEGLQRVGDRWAYTALAGAHENYPVFAEQDDGQWLLMPVLDHTQAILLRALPGDVLLRKMEPDGEAPYPYWDTSLSTAATMTETMPLRVSDAVRLADTIRYGKARKPNNANIAGYLYDFVGDIDNTRRTAHYMVEDSVLPIDLALLAAEQLRWQQDQDGFWQVRADLPAIEEDSDAPPNRPRFTTGAFDAKYDVPVRGIFPIFRQGFFMLVEADHLEPPPILGKIAKSLAGRSAVLLPPYAMVVLAGVFGYRTFAAKEAEAGGVADLSAHTEESEW